jgi:hypothetical protein
VLALLLGATLEKERIGPRGGEGQRPDRRLVPRIYFIIEDILVYKSHYVEILAVVVIFRVKGISLKKLDLRQGIR